MKICVWGGGGALAQHLIQHYVEKTWDVVATCHRSAPQLQGNPNVTVVWMAESDAVLAGMGPFDALVTLTGGVMNNKLSDISDYSWQESISSNLTSVFKAFRRCLRHVRDGGSVVAVGSVVGSTGGYGCANYAAAKAGLVGLVRAAANENARRGLRVNLLELGYVDSGMGAKLPLDIRNKIVQTIPLGHFAEPAEFVKAVDFLVDSPYMTGGVLTLAGGLR